VAIATLLQQNVLCLTYYLQMLPAHIHSSLGIKGKIKCGSLFAKILQDDLFWMTRMPGPMNYIDLLKRGASIFSLIHGKVQ